jgi:ribosomal protein S18 acetylase RimI-like enzyme
MTDLLPAELDWRPLSTELIDAWHPLRAALALADGSTEFPAPADLLDELSADWLDLSSDTVIGLDPAGVARAYAMVEIRPGDTTLLRAWGPGGVHPKVRGRGIGTALLAWQRGRAQQLVAARRAQLADQVPAMMRIEVPRGAPSQAALLERAGFTAARLSLVMRRSLELPIEQLPVPRGLTVVPFDPVFDERTHLAHNTAFVDHEGFQPWSGDVWQQWATGHRGFRPDWTFLALDGDQIAGYVLSAAYPDEWDVFGFSQGYVSKLGTVPAWRGRGVARALLTRALTAFAAARLDYAGLDVDAGNDTGALRLYTSLGFEEWDRATLWDMPL